MKHNIEAIRASISVPQLLRRLGVDCPDGARMIKAPHRDDKSPSCSIFDDGKRFKDFGSDASGTVIDLLMLMTGVSHGDAIAELAKMVGVEGEVDLDGSPLSQIPSPPNRRNVMDSELVSIEKLRAMRINLKHQLETRPAGGAAKALAWIPDDLLLPILRKGWLGADHHGTLCYLYRRGWKARHDPSSSRGDRWKNGKAKDNMFISFRDSDIHDQKKTKLVLCEGECLSGDSEVLTPDGWVNIKDYVDSGTAPIAQWDWDGKIGWVIPSRKIKSSSGGKWMHFRHHQIDQMVTRNHKMVAIDYKGRPMEVKAKNWMTGPHKIPKCGTLDGPGVPLTDDQIALCLAVSADSAFRIKGYSSPYVVFSLLKRRKIKRLLGLLKRLGVKHHVGPLKSGQTSVCFHAPEYVTGKMLDWSWVELATIEQREFILKELVLWDGNTVPNRKQTEFSSKEIRNAEWAQAMCVTCGRASTIMPRSNQFGSWFKVSMLHGKTHCSHQKKPTPINGDLDAYCVTVPSGMFLMRRNGIASVTGNSDTMAATIQMGETHRIAGCLSCSIMPPMEIIYPLIRGVDEITIAFDGDDAGRAGSQKMRSYIASHCNVKVKIANMPEGEDIKSLYLKQLKERVRR